MRIPSTKLAGYDDPVAVAVAVAVAVLGDPGWPRGMPFSSSSCDIDCDICSKKGRGT